jgi:hypothetical protein
MLVERVFIGISEVAEGPAHFFDSLHVFDSRMERRGRRVQVLQRHLTGGLGGGPRLLSGVPSRFAGLPEELSLLPHVLERFSTTVAALAGIFCRESEAFRLVPRGFGRGAAFLGGVAILRWPRVIV